METIVESARGCGYRKPGGLYFIGVSFGLTCGKLPMFLDRCPCCNAGIKFSRGFQWISSALIENATCASGNECRNCMILSGKMEKLGLMWVGEAFYKTPEDFIKEGRRLGISKRISSVPKDFVIGTDWILLAHRKAVTALDDHGEIVMKPGLFQAFKPTHIEYVVTGEETDEELERLQKRGIVAVKVVKDTDAQMEIV